MGGAAGMIGAIGGMAGQGGSKIGGMVGSIVNLVYQKKVTNPALKALGIAEMEETRRAGREIGGRQVTGYAKAGVRTDVGTPLRVAAETAARSELAALRARFAYRQAIYDQTQQATIGLVTSLLMMGGSALSTASNLNLGQKQGGGYPSGAYSAKSSAAAGLPYYGSDQPTGGGMYTLPEFWSK